MVRARPRGCLGVGSSFGLPLFITGSAGEGPRSKRPFLVFAGGLNPRFAESLRNCRVGCRAVAWRNATRRTARTFVVIDHDNGNTRPSRCVGRWSSCRGGVVVVRPACGVVARGLAGHHHQGGPHEIRTEATVAGHPLGSNSEAKSTRTRLGRIIGRLRPTWCRRIEPSSGRVASAIVLGGITPCGWSTFLLARVTCPSSPKSGTR